MNFHLKITASARSFFDGECESLIVPTEAGMYGILAMHESAVIGITVGAMKYRLPGERDHTTVVVGEGFARVSNNTVTVLVDSVELPEEIDANRAREAKARALEHMQQRKSLHEYYQGKLAMTRAMTRLKVKEGKYL